jgi:isoquinoline 1-oxidoreductase alpha subunit
MEADILLLDRHAEESMIRFQVNRNEVEFEGEAETPLLWVLRDHLRLTGTKYACGIGRCGACTVHIDGKASAACTTTVSSVAGRSITTIEGLAPAAEQLHPVQQAWIEEDVSQCGYCQAGQIMTAVELLTLNPKPSDQEIDRKMTNLCRCGTYIRVRKAIHRASGLMAAEE